MCWPPVGREVGNEAADTRLPQRVVVCKSTHTTLSQQIMGISPSSSSHPSPKIFGSQTLASLARIFGAKGHGNGGLIQHRQDTDLREEIDTMKKRMSDLTQERDKANADTKEKSVALAAVQQERDALSGRMEELRKKSTILAEEIGALNGKLEQAHGQSDSLKQQLGRRETEMQIVANELFQIKTKHGQTVALLDARTAELKGAQAFLTKADSMSGADVVRMVEGLDAEILQTAAFVADHFVVEKRQGMTEEVQAAIDRLVDLLGPKIVDLLGRAEHANDPTLIQLACQAATTTYARWIIVSWDFDDPNYDNFLKHIYITVQQAGELTSSLRNSSHLIIDLRGSSHCGAMASTDSDTCPEHASWGRGRIIGPRPTRR
jgi:hypothetical protein